MRGALLIVVVATGVAAPVARADIGVRDVTPRLANPGDRIHITAGGYIGEHRDTFPIVMLPETRAPKPYSCHGGSAVCTPAVYRSALMKAPFVRVATLRSSHARFAIRVPRLRPGRYVFALFCERCTRGPKGSLIVAERLVLRVR